MVASPRETGEKAKIIVPELSESAFDVIFDTAYEEIGDFEDIDQVISFLDLSIRLQLSDEHEISIKKPDIAQQIRLICCSDQGFEVLKKQNKLKEALMKRLEMFGVLKITRVQKPLKKDSAEESFNLANKTLERARRTLRGVISSMPPPPKTESIKEFGFSLEEFVAIHSSINTQALTFIQDLAEALTINGMRIPEDRIKESFFRIIFNLSGKIGVSKAHKFIRESPENLWELLIAELKSKS